MVGAGLLINLLAPPSPPKKEGSLPRLKLEQTRKFFSPEGKKISWSPKLLYSIMAKAKKNIAVEEIKKNTHTF